MTWDCPACRTPLQIPNDMPQPASVYRCRTCKLELVRNEQGDALVLRPLEDERKSVSTGPRPEHRADDEPPPRRGKMN